jgi:phenol 2-monooxygenase
MNVSIHDSFNLGWKLASVVRGQCVPEILHTYSAERRTIAEELIAFDRELATMFSAPVESASGPAGMASKSTQLQEYMVKHDGYVSGTLSRYGPSMICGDSAHQDLARGFEIGKRFHSAPVVRLADARPVHLGHVLEGDGRWRIVAFASGEDPAGEESGIRKLAAYLEDSGRSPLRKYTPAGADVDAVIELLTVFQQGYRELEFESLPALLWPAKGVYGLRDYEKTFCPDLDNGTDIFEQRGIDRQRGCMVVVRPDQHVANVLPLDGFAELAEFLDGIFIDRH